jgi:phage terminase large subunit-like protein
MARKSHAQPKITDETTQHAADILSGKIISGELIRAAAKRHLDRVNNPGPYIWRPDLAQAAFDFFPNVLTIQSSDPAFQGKPFHLLPWMKFCVGQIDGWYQQNEQRLIRTSWTEGGKGIAKSFLLPAYSFKTLLGSGLHRPVVFAVAGSKEQSNVVFNNACRMAKAGGNDSLEGMGYVVIRGTGELAYLIETPANDGKFSRISADGAVSGPLPTLILADEIQEWTRGNAHGLKPLETLTAGLVKSPVPSLMLMGLNTPSETNLAANSMSQYYQKVALGQIEDPSSLALIYRTDPTDDPFQDETCWVKSIPTLDITYPRDGLRAEVAKAKWIPPKKAEIGQLFFGIPGSEVDMWIDRTAWEATIAENFAPDDFADEPCVVSLDLSRKNDLTALGICWKSTDGNGNTALYADCKYWKPEKGLTKSISEDQAPYDQWAQGDDPFLNVVKNSNSIDYRYVVRELRDICEGNNVTALVFDAAFMADFLDACAEEDFPIWKYLGPGKPTGSGLKAITHYQGNRGMDSEIGFWMPDSVRALEDAILQSKLHIKPNPITTWCSANAKYDDSTQQNRFFSKKKSRGRIDGLVAIAMAVGGMNKLHMKTPPVKKKSFWMDDDDSE